MNHLYLGVDVAGARNTWVAGLVRDGQRLTVALEPKPATLQAIVDTCRTKPVAAVAIDAHLTMSLQAETGFRPSDLKLRQLLPADCRNWVASANSMMAVPVRGQLLADHLAPYVGTILETHPRASLWLGLGEAVANAVRAYKRTGERGQGALQTLWALWSKRHGIYAEQAPAHDGALDALVCATAAYLFHHEPETLLRLTEPNETLSGRGPFYVVDRPS